MKLKKKEEQSLENSPLLRIGNKTPMEGVIETKFGAEMNRWTAAPWDLSHTQPPNTDIIAYASKILLKVDAHS